MRTKKFSISHYLLVNILTNFINYLLWRECEEVQMRKSLSKLNGSMSKVVNFKLTGGVFSYPLHDSSLKWNYAICSPLSVATLRLKKVNYSCYSLLFI